VLRCLQMVAKAAKAAGIPVSICGEMAGDTEFTPVLLGMGFAQLSMNAGSIPKVKRLIREVRQAECSALLAEVMQCTTAQEAERQVHAFMAAKVSFANSIIGPLG
ncbi:MAG: phosphoenolpyruvate--protein phosphotransferase, partial [Deltaproteobacteria bacterium]